MESSVDIKSSQKAIYSKSTVNSKSDLGAYTKFIEKLNFSYFGIISMTILIGSIVGGIAASFILANNAPIWQLGVCAAVSMANNTAGIGQAPTKWVVNLFLVSLVVNTLLLLVNL
jgi:hypothetical protein